MYSIGARRGKKRFKYAMMILVSLCVCHLMAKLSRQANIAFKYPWGTVMSSKKDFLC